VSAAQLLALIGREPGPRPGVPLRLSHPVAQRLGGATDLFRDRTDRPPLRSGLRPSVQHHPDGPLLDLRAKPRSSCLLRHGSNLSREGVSDKPGAVQERAVACTSELEIATLLSIDGRA
jgi:hypothetical protein